MPLTDEQLKLARDELFPDEILKKLFIEIQLQYGRPFTDDESTFAGHIAAMVITFTIQRFAEVNEQVITTKLH